MARFLVLIRATACATCKPQPFQTIACAISVSSDPAIGLASLQEYSPVPCELIHVIESGARTDYLERTLHIKYRAQRARNFWFNLSESDIAFIQTLTTQNFFTIAGFLNKKIVPPAIATEALPDFIAEQLAACDSLLTDERNTQ